MSTNTLDCSVKYSVQRYGGYFARALFTCSPLADSIEVVAPIGVAVWTVPANEWDRLRRLPIAWRDPVARPLTPGDEPWVGAIRRGVIDQAVKLGTKIVARLTLIAVRVHPNDTSEGVCEQLGREMLDTAIEWLAKQKNIKPGTVVDSEGM